MSKYRSILLFGAPGSGKGTQGKILGSIPGFFHLSCGEVFRTMDVRSEIGKVFYEYSSRGELVPDDFTVRMWKQHLEGRVATGEFNPAEEFLILDGIPRNVEQAVLLEDTVNVVLILHLQCHDPDAMIDRLRRRALKENRADDAREDVIRRRWEIYKEETKPILEHYPDDKIRGANANGTPLEVLQEILRHLKEFEYVGQQKQ